MLNSVPGHLCVKVTRMSQDGFLALCSWQPGWWTLYRICTLVLWLEQIIVIKRDLYYSPYSEVAIVSSVTWRVLVVFILFSMGGYTWILICFIQAGSHIFEQKCKPHPQSSLLGQGELLGEGVQESAMGVKFFGLRWISWWRGPRIIDAITKMPIRWPKVLPSWMGRYTIGIRHVQCVILYLCECADVFSLIIVDWNWSNVITYLACKVVEWNVFAFNLWSEVTGQSWLKASFQRGLDGVPAVQT